MPPWSQRDGTSEATSFYDTSSLKTTLERLVDFDRLNAGMIRFSAGAVNVRTGNVVYFDNSTHTIMPEHIIASAALPPGFPAIEIDDEHYWDGGLVSNTPLEGLLESGAPQDKLAFQVDVWSPRGQIPRNMAEVATRQKEIYSSRTRPSLRQLRRVQHLRRALAALLDPLPEDLSEDEDVKLLKTSSICHNVYNIVQSTYRARNHEEHSKDYEFSRVSMQERWRAGYKDALRVLRHREVFGRPTSPDGVFTFDLDQDRRE
ncbi:patatin-like phospholipase family protein [Bradyrhizobium sp. USDA 4354]